VTIAVDGRHARRDANRDKVVDALLDLFREGELAPSAAQVAERSGVSHRSVFRYFEDLDQLCRVSIERHAASVAHLLVIDDLGKGSLAERIDAMIDARLELYDAVAPIVRVTRVRAPFQPLLEERLAADRARLDRQVNQQFVDELSQLDQHERNAISRAIQTMCSLDSVELLRHSNQLSRAETAEVLRTTLGRLLTPTRGAV